TRPRGVVPPPGRNAGKAFWRRIGGSGYNPGMNTSGSSAMSGSRILLATLMALAMLAQPTAAHHSTAMFDSDNPVDLYGTVKEWQFTNPHVFLILTVEGEDGSVIDWTLEGLSPNVIYRQGWTPDSLRPGDKVIVTVRPLHSGAPGGSYSNPRWADGTPIDPRAERPATAAGGV